METLNIPLYMQRAETNWCVPYTMVGIANYYNIDVSKKDMILALKANKTGTYIEDCVKGIEKVGLKFKRIKFNYSNIRKSIKQGIPVVVSYMYGRNESHFSTIIGAYRNTRSIVFYTLNDTYYGVYDIPGSILDYLMYKDDTPGIWSRQVVLL